MKTLLHALIILFLTATTVSAQEYEPLLNNTKWYYQWSDFLGSGSVKIENVGQTTVGNYTYTRLATQFEEFLLREDVAARKVYFLHNGVDELLYDFSLQVNDVITVGPNQFQLVSIQTINVNGGTRRAFILNDLSSSFWLPEIWIEGVGMRDRLFYPWYENPSDPVYSLQCTYQNDVNVYNQGILNNTMPTDCASLGVVTARESSAKIGFAPNPLRGELTISSAIALNNATLTITNALGQTVAEIPNLNGNTVTINRNNIQSGLYVAVLLQNGKAIAVEKLQVTN